MLDCCKVRSQTPVIVTGETCGIRRILSFSGWIADVGAYTIASIWPTAIRGEQTTPGASRNCAAPIDHSPEVTINQNAGLAPSAGTEFIDGE